MAFFEKVAKLRKIQRENVSLCQSFTLEAFKQFVCWPMNSHQRFTDQQVVVVVLATNMQPWNWYKCPNGYGYLITAWGRIMECQCCLICNSAIGKSTAKSPLRWMDHSTLLGLRPTTFKTLSAWLLKAIREKSVNVCWSQLCLYHVAGLAGLGLLDYYSVYLKGHNGWMRQSTLLVIILHEKVFTQNSFVSS